MRHGVDEWGVQIDGRAEVAGIALVVAVARHGDVQRLADIAADDHRDGDVFGEGRPPCEVGGTHPQ
ncbi:hypothetical protein [Bacteroides heparinolyticus]|uniref:hypothetical protein n=1 Tax=Prevotella heparinolytica TaxID=28113 RepID=UPI00359F38CE